MTGTIYVDDSGNPGAESGSGFLLSTRKSWTAVIVPSVVAGKLDQAMAIFLSGIREEFGASELHFTEVWSGKGPWKNVSPSSRAEIFALMGDIMRRFALPIVHQTFSAQTLNDHPEIRNELNGAKSGEWQLDEIFQLGLLFLCSRVCHHIRKLRESGPQDIDASFEMYVDEGLLPAGQRRSLPNWSDVIRGPELKFANSRVVTGLQLADFAAFVITRSQWIAATRTTKPAYEQAESAIFLAASSLNILNLPSIALPSSELDIRRYEELLRSDRDNKGLSSEFDGT